MSYIFSLLEQIGSSFLSFFLFFTWSASTASTTKAIAAQATATGTRIREETCLNLKEDCKKLCLVTVATSGKLASHPFPGVNRD